MTLQNPSLSVTFSFFILCILATSHFLNQAIPQQTTIGEATSTPDAFATGVTASYLNQEGKLQTQFNTPKMWHYYTHNKTEFENPHFLIYSKDNLPWHIFAAHGEALSGIESVLLWDNVHVHQDQSKLHHELNLTTTAMTLHPKIQTADTGQPVLLTQPGYQVSAVGLHLSLKEEKVDLISNAQGVFTSNFLQNPTR